MNYTWYAPIIQSEREFKRVAVVFADLLQLAAALQEGLRTLRGVFPRPQ